MKRWSSQVFPLFVLGLLAALSFWLERAVNLPEARHDGKQRHDPDSFVENAVIRRFSAEGQLQYHLVAPALQHFADDDSTLVEKPLLTYFRPGAPDMTLAGNHGYVAAKGETVYFWENVVATRAATEKRPEMRAVMPDITVQPDEGTAFTDSTVEITQGGSWLKGTGMNLDNNTSIFVLHSEVRGYYLSPKTKP